MIFRSKVFRASPAATAAVHSFRDTPTGYTTHHVDLNLTEYTSGKLHWATIEGLEPSSTFYYACGDEERGLSSVREFTTPSAVGPSQAVTFGVLGDLGQTNDSR